MKFRGFSKLVEALLGSFQDALGVVLPADNVVGDVVLGRNIAFTILKKLEIFDNEQRVFHSRTLVN